MNSANKSLPNFLFFLPWLKIAFSILLSSPIQQGMNKTYELEFYTFPLLIFHKQKPNFI